MTREDNTLKRKLTYEVVYDIIKRRIEDGVWKPGDRLPTIEELSTELNVGLSSVREAIRILNQQHILLVEQGRGTFVREDLPTEDDRGAVAFLEKASWLQLTEARRIMEPELAAMAAINRTQQQAEALLANAAAMARKAGKGQDFLKEDLTFHRLIAEAAGNDVILHMLGVISDLLLDSRRKTMRIHGMDEKASSYHTLIARAIAQQEANKARDLMRMHIQDMIDELSG